MNTRTLIITFVWMIMSNIGIFAQEHWDAQERIELNKGVFPKIKLLILYSMIY